MAIRTLEAEPAESPAAPALAHIGHNKPPLEELIPLEFRAALLDGKPDFLARFEALIDAADRATATDDETLGRCGDLVKAYRACTARIDATHATVKAPHLLAGRLVDAEKNTLAGRLAIAKAKVEGIGNAYAAKKAAEDMAKRERIAAEQRAAADRAMDAERERFRLEAEAARAASEATNAVEREAAIERARIATIQAEEAQRAAALAPAAVTKAEPVRSDAGATVSSKQEWKCEIEDYTKAMRHVRSDPKVKEAIDAAIARLVRAGQRELTGVKIWPVAKANFR